MRPDLLLRALLAAILFAAAPQCGGQVGTPGTGSETNWVVSCRRDVECARDACLCGVCTAPCDDARDCGAGQTCVRAGTNDHADVCGRPDDEPNGLCLASCSADSDCLNGAVCDGGVCKPRPIGERRGTSVGAPCVLEDERRVDFAGFDARGLHFESFTPACDTRLCMVLRFQGRPGCPYGQDGSTANGCQTPDDARITVPVAPQLVDRPPEDAIYCSCRCDGPEGTGPFCACPQGFECRRAWDLVGLDDPLEGSYCVKAGTYVDPEAVDELERGPLCDRTLDNCRDR